MLKYRLFQSFPVPFFRMCFFFRKAICDFLGFILNHLFDGRFQTFPVQGFPAVSYNFV